MYKKQYQKNLGIIIALLVTIAIVMISYVSYITYAAKKRTLSTLSEISHQNQAIFTLEMERYAKIIESSADYIEKLGYTSFDDILNFLKLSHSNNQEHLLGIATPDGNLTAVNGVKIDLSQSPNIKEIFNSNETKFFCDSYQSSSFLVCTTPLKINGENKFAIFSTYPVSRYADSISIPTFENKGYSYVINSSGERIVGSSHANSFGLTFNNYFDEMRKASSKNNKNIERIQDDLKNGKSNSIVVINKISTFVYYTPLGINDWYILTVVPKTIITKYTSQILICCYLFVLFCLIVFFYLSHSAIKAQITGQKQLEDMAYIDSLTGGMSYSKFTLEAENMLINNPNENYALINLDINNFQYINDFFGDEEGNRALRFLWSTIDTRLKSKELCARIFDDHFVALITYDNTESLDNTFKDFFNSLKLYTPKNGTYNMTVSVGIYLIYDRNITITSMLNRARTTQKHLKGHSSQSQYAVYSAKQRDDIMMQKTIENDFENAIKAKEFKVYFQPKFNINSNKFDGAEALVRWQKPDGTIISPGQFIPLFEKNGDIVKLDKYVLEETCSEIRKWLDLGYEVSPISVNVSLLQLLDKNFVEDHIKTVKKYGIPLDLIELEFTESILAENESLVVSLTKQCKEHEIKVLLDDFGSGYSSLNMLNILPCDIVKLDKRFVDKLETDDKSKAIVSSTIALAHTLHMSVTAEGVETKNQYDLLKEMSCDTIQGFYCAKPMPEQDYENLIKS